jgi:pullulanase/glycogen debranching enzyme
MDRPSPRCGDRGDPGRGLQPHRRGNELGPTLSFKGIDNASYYRLAPDRRYYINDTGTGNTVNLSNSAFSRW